MLAKLGFSIVLTLTTMALAQPTTQPAPVDLSSPASPVRSMYRATAASDTANLALVFDAPTPQSRDLVSTYSDLIVAGRHLQDAIRDTFAEDANAKPANRPPTPINATEEAQLNAAEIHIDGDTATVKFAPPRPSITLHQTAGQWRIDLQKYAGGTAASLDEQIEMNRSLAAVMAETADEVTTGKYASAQEAESDVQQKIHAVIARELKNNPPTRPATGPSTHP